MSTLNWIGGAGSLSWATGANWDTGSAPVTGDTVYISSGNSDINSGLAQSAVTLAALYIVGGIGGFTGTIGTTGNSSDSLAIGATIVIVNCGSGRIKLDFGSVTHTTTVLQTGPSLDSGLEAFRIRGGTGSSKLYVAGTSTTTVGIATTRAGITATLSEFDIESGTLAAGTGLTWTTAKQSGGTLTTNSGGTTLTQSGTTAALTTQGTGAITTVSVTSTAFLNHRPASGTDFIATLNVGPGATADMSTDPRPATFTNAPLIAKGGKFLAFSPGQLQLTGGSPVDLPIKCQQCGLNDVSINIGAQVQATVKAW